MEKPKYSVGTKVKHTSKGVWGVVIDRFPSDGGWRYYVNHSGFTWSVPEAYLTQGRLPSD